MKYGDGRPKKPGTVDFFASCCPQYQLTTYRTFSVGFFMWVTSKSSSHAKKGKVFRRERFFSSDRKWEQKAEKIRKNLARVVGRIESVERYEVVHE